MSMRPYRPKPARPTTPAGPPPGPAYDERGDRRWSRRIAEEPVPESEADRYLQRVRAIDPDIWIIEVEYPHAFGLLDLGRGA